MTDKVQKILSEIATRKLYTMDEHMAFYSDKAKEDYRLLSDIEEFIKALQEEPVSEDLEDAAIMHFKDAMEYKIKTGLKMAHMTSFKAGAKWQKINLWKPADGEDLPEYDREVIVLVKYSTQRNIHDEEYPTYRVGFGHRPDPNGWDGKSVTTGKVEHYTPKTYGKGGWNMPDVVLWLDLDIPKLEED